MDEFSTTPPRASLLLGKTIAALTPSDSDDALGFVFDDGQGAPWVAYGDCCSETWFADIVGVDELLGSPVVEVRTVEMSEIGYVCDGSRQVASDHGAPQECGMPQWHARRLAKALDRGLGTARLLTDPRPGRFKSL